jgi:hypothetical protein
MLCDESGAVRDFVAWGYTAANISTINLTNVLVGSTTYPAITVPTTQWSGNGTVADFLSTIKTRTGTSDHNTAADWVGGTSEANKGQQNTALSVPFVPPPPVIQVTPNVVSLINGVWTGPFAVNQLTAGMKLVANDGAGITGSSNIFDSIAPQTPAIASAGNALGVVGGAFSYQIVGTNAPTSYGATGLPNGLNISQGTGLISGTPSSAGTVMVTVLRDKQRRHGKFACYDRHSIRCGRGWNG